MGIFDRLRGRDSAPASPSGTELPAEGLSPAQASKAAAPELLDVTSFGSAPDQGSPGSSGRLYNPYEGLNTAIDHGRSLKTAYKLPQQPEFLFSEESTVHRRSWSENLTYYTGTGYVTGNSATCVLSVLTASREAQALNQQPGWCPASGP